MRLTFNAFVLAASISPALSTADVMQISVSSSALPHSSCEIDPLSDDVFLTGHITGKKTQSDCAVSVSKPLFFEQYKYCALSGLKEYNDEKNNSGRNLGSHCSFEIKENDVVFSASRGFGLKEGSFSSLFCIFTCIQNVESGVKRGRDLQFIKSKPLLPWE
jgi:hypothetical protein